MSRRNTLNKNIIERDISREMEKSYIDYSMSVIVSRALPDVRDGLKPVHRRILYSMYEQKYTHDKSFKKSARIVGDVMGKYHPHGDSAIYNAMVRLAQDFSTRYMLVEGQGNFGSIDGDGAAAMRYTEARLSAISDELLRDLDKETVDFYPNYDESLVQPWVLPARFPNLLVNGSTGIAVGMTTSIPPHNLGEVIDATVHTIDNPDCYVEDLLEIIEGPDFPTGATIMGKESMKNAYRTGHGRVRIRSKAGIEEFGNNRYRIVVTEIPYMVNKTKLLESIADLVKSKKIDGITEMRDESSRHGIRIILEIRRDANPNIILNQLYKNSTLESVFSMIFIALDGGMPKVFNLKEMIEKYILHQKDVETRRIEFDLRKARDRAHILEGLLIALQNIDEIIKIIRSSYDNAREKLMERFEFTEIQANNILSMQLRRLQGLEYEKINDEYQGLKKNIAYYLEVLGNEDLLMGIIKDSLIEIKNKYSDERRTTIEHSYEELEDEDLIEEREMVITLTQRGYVKRVAQDVYQSQNRGGKGIIGLTTRDEDIIYDIFTTSTHSDLMYFTNLGRLYRLKAYRIPESSRQSRGTPIINLLQLDKGEKVTSIIPVGEMDERRLVLATKKGVINKMLLSDLESNRQGGIKVIRLDEGDEVIHVKIIEDDSDIFVATRKGKAIRFPSSEMRVLSRNTRGVKSIELQEDDEVVSVDVVADNQGDVLTITSKGFGKLTDIKNYRSQGRGGKGMINYRLTEKTGDVVASTLASSDDEIFLISSVGTMIRIRVSDISKMGRNTSGVSIMRFEEDVEVVAFAKAVDIEEDEEDGSKD
ncbi:MAG: DNA gyrase subunit A [Tissierellia bacterium]|nr:DNA gyrase subunit A [Tissierellia bacterium]